MWHSSNRDKPPFHRSRSEEEYPKGSSIFHKTTTILRYLLSLHVRAEYGFRYKGISYVMLRYEQ